MERMRKTRVAHDENSTSHRIVFGCSRLVCILREDGQIEVAEGRTRGSDRESQVGEET